MPDDWVPLALLLLRAGRWFDRRVVAGLEELGWPRLTAAQTLAFAHLDAHGTPPAELARRLGTTRQATADLVSGLERLGVLQVVPDPARVRGRLVRLSPSGERLAGEARRLFESLEGGLPSDEIATLRGVLARLGLGDAE